MSEPATRHDVGTGPAMVDGPGPGPWPDRIELVGAILTVVGIAVLVGVLLLQDRVGAATPLVGGLALNAAIVGPVLAARRLGPRLRERLPPWLGW